MKKLIFTLTLLALFVACEDSKSDKHAMLPTSSGNINNLQVVIDDDLWSGEVGEVIRNHFAATVDGLPQEEPLFTINQLPLNSFDGFTQNNRIFLYVKKGEKKQIKSTIDHYAKPQNGVFISGNTNEELIDVINENALDIISGFKESEMNEKQRRMSLSRLNVQPLKDSLKISLTMPSVYRFAKLSKEFAWLRKDIRTGDLNMLIYEMPLDAFQNEETRMQEIISMRDSIGKKHIHGTVEGSYMITEKAFAPYLFETKVNDRFAYQAKGTWELYNFFMAGPFVNYIIEDKPNDRYLVIEGFTFAPSIDKRDYQFELESIINSIEFE